MTVREELIEIRQRLGGVFDRREREAVILLIFSHVKGWSRVDLIINEGAELSDFSKREIDSIVDRLILGEPIQYITRRARFYGMDLRVGPGVLIPRPETEELVDWIVDDAKGREDLKILDIGTGSGCIAIALARTLPFSEATGLDISRNAITQALANAVAFNAKVGLIADDMYKWLPETQEFDIIVSNPPYIHPDEAADMEVRVKDFEPHEALFVSADDPIRPYKRIEEVARVGLKPDAYIYLELNPRYAEEVKIYYESKGWENVEIRIDSYGKKRFLKARKPRRKRPW